MKRILLLLAATVTVTCGYALWPTSVSVDPAPYIAKAQQYDVTIHRDKWGVPHVYGPRDRDVVFGLAYAHAEDDFATIQEVILTTRGRLGSVRGPEGAKTDFVVGWFRVWDTVAEGWPKLPDEVRAIATAWADGVNLFAAQHPNTLIAEEILPIDGRDVLAGFVLKTPFFYGLDQTLAEVFDDQRGRSVATAPGSNAFAVAPKRSADGRTRLIVNSHQPFAGPVAWYEARLKSEEGLDITGGLFPGAPLILHGHNRWLGWASTVNRPDLADVYVLEIDPDDPMRYRLDGEWKRLESRSIDIEVRLFGRLTWTVTEEALASAHGPVARTSHGTYAIRFAGMGETRQLEQYLAMNKARTLDDWMAALKMQALPSINFVYADGTGRIAFVYNARLPVRAPGWKWREYLPGDRSDLIWHEQVPFDALPKVVDPASGFLFSVNSTPFSVTDGPDNPEQSSFPAEHGIETRLNNRAMRALATFGADPSITREAWARYKYDKRYDPKSPVGEAVRRVLEADFDDPIAAKAQVVLKSWDFSTDLDNPGAAIGVLGVADVLVRQRWRHHAPQLLPHFAFVARNLQEAHGRIDAPWREVSRHERGTVDLPIAGGPDVLRAMHYTDLEEGRVRAKRGDSFLMFVEWDADGTVTSSTVHPYGSATLDAASLHYADQAPLFANEQLKALPFEKADLDANLERTYAPLQVGRGSAQPDM